jgi:hypothetical protein
MGLNDHIYNGIVGTFKKLTATQSLVVGNQAILAGQGNTYFVDSGSGADTNDGSSWANALATLDAAINKCTANQGDIILLAPGHAENVAAASGITIDVAGIKIKSVGEGNDRAKFTFTATDSTIVISAASVVIEDIITIAGIDSVVSPIVVSGADVSIKMTHRDDASDVEAVRAVLTTATADRFTLDLEYLGQSGGNACVNAVRLVGANGARINLNAYGLFSTAAIELHTTACSNIYLVGNMYNHGTADYSKTLVDTVTGSTWAVNYFDGESGKNASGSQDVAIAAI